MDTARDRWGDGVAGLLLGGALGDAVGRPFEGSSSVRTSAVDEVLGQEGGDGRGRSVPRPAGGTVVADGSGRA